MSNGSWLLHPQGAEHTSGPGVREGQGGTRESGSLADPAVAPSLHPPNLTQESLCDLPDDTV